MFVTNKIRIKVKDTKKVSYFPSCVCTENLLTNNLVRRKDELVQALQEISVEDRNQQLENSINDLKVIIDKVAIFRFYPIPPILISSLA